MKKIWNQLVILFSFVWFPILLLALFVFLAFKITGYQNPETINVTLGVMLGVALGFIADISKRSLDDFQKKNTLRKVAFALLKNDAEDIYRSMESIGEMRVNKHKAPKELQNAIDQQLPPPLELRYWKRLNQDNSFILLGSEEPFKSIFNDLWSIEQINKQIEQALQQNKQSYMFAMAMYNTSLEQRFHEELLTKFMESVELEDFKKNWRTIKKRSKSTSK